jgi:hypothetical protein
MMRRRQLRAWRAKVEKLDILSLAPLEQAG